MKNSGWKRITVKGDAKERGFMHGSLLAEEMRKLLEAFHVGIKEDYKISLDQYIDFCKKIGDLNLAKEWRDELEGMIEGFLSRGVVVSYDFLCAWNLYLSVATFFEKKHVDRCSAFIATGDATKDGQIVMAHNTHCAFLWGQFYNIIQYTKPSKGQGRAFIMQTAPGLLCSNVDWFLCESGIVGCETTIARTTYFPDFSGKNTPYFCRIRECMQYANSLDDCERIMSTGNAGDYACGWLFGDVNSGEIMLLEVAKTVASRRTKSGVFYGSNFAHDATIRRTQTTNDKEFENPKSSIRCRGERIDWLLNELHWGELDAKIAKTIISDHYDQHRHATRRGNRSICKHGELNSERSGKRPAHYPFGAIDGKVVTSDMAKKMAFFGRWGSSCGRSYRPNKTWKRKIPYLPIFRKEPWTKLQ